MEENGRKPALLSGGGMLAHDLQTVKVLLSAARNTVHLRCSLG